MKPVDQTIVDEGRGDCVRACLASMLEAPITAVPNFSDAPQGFFHTLYQATLYGYGYLLGQAAHPDGRAWSSDLGIGGHFMASVPSRNIDGTHAVVINGNGLVVHDPSPYKNYQGENIFESGAIHYFETYHPRCDQWWEVYQHAMVRKQMAENAAPEAPPAWQQRLIGERKQLLDRLERLGIFMTGPAFKELDKTDSKLLATQYGHMSDYAGILAARIKRAEAGS